MTPEKSKHISHLLLLISLMAVVLSSVGVVRADIADCRIDSHCNSIDNGECCARVIVTDSLGNSIDSHYCLEQAIL
jgi:hypothetical protein